jgi:hypothetical protein
VRIPVPKVFSAAAAVVVLSISAAVLAPSVAGADCDSSSGSSMSGFDSQSPVVTSSVSVQNGLTGGTVLSVDPTVAGSQALVVVTQWQASGNCPTVTDGNGDVFVDDECSGTGAEGIDVEESFPRVSMTGSTAVTATWGASSTYRWLEVYSVTGLSEAGIDVAATGGPASVVSEVTGKLSPAASDDFAVVVASGANQALLPAAPDDGLVAQSVPNPTIGGVSMGQVGGTSGWKAAAVSLSGTEQLAVSAVLFEVEPAFSGAPAVVSVGGCQTVAVQGVSRTDLAVVLAVLAVTCGALFIRGVLGFGG